MDIWVSPLAVHPPPQSYGPPDLRITRYLQHLEAFRLQLLFAAFGRSQALFTRYLQHLEALRL